MAAAAAFVFYFSCIGKANAEELPDINLDILGNDDISNNIVNNNSSNINSNRVISSRKIVADNKTDLAENDIDEIITNNSSLTFGDLSPQIQAIISNENNNSLNTENATVNDNSSFLTVSQEAGQALPNNFSAQENIAVVNNQSQVAAEPMRAKKSIAVEPLNAEPDSVNKNPLDPPSPTLDDVNAQSSEWLDSEHSTYELSTDEIENGSTVKINGTTYYYTPSD